MTTTCDLERLIRAIFENDVESVRRLVRAGVEINSISRAGFTPLMQAVEAESLEIARFLIDNGALINARGSEGRAPLHVAVDLSIDGTIQNGGKPGDEPTQMIEFLLECGAEKDIADDKGSTPMDCAEGYKSHFIVGVLQGAQS